MVAASLLAGLPGGPIVAAPALPRVISGYAGGRGGRNGRGGFRRAHKRAWKALRQYRKCYSHAFTEYFTVKNLDRRERGERAVA